MCAFPDAEGEAFLLLGCRVGRGCRGCRCVGVCWGRRGGGGGRGSIGGGGSIILVKLQYGAFFEFKDTPEAAVDGCVEDVYEARGGGGGGGVLVWGDDVEGDATFWGVAIKVEFESMLLGVGRYGGI